VVIAVDVGWAPLRSRVRHLPDVIIKTIDILSRQAAASRWVDCDILIEPELGNVRSPSSTGLQKSWRRQAGSPESSAGDRSSPG